MRGKLCIFYLIVLLFMTAGIAKADDSARIQFDPVPLDDFWVDGRLDLNEYHYYPVEITATGKLKITAQSFFEYFRTDILDADYVRFAEKGNINGSNGTPATVEFEYYLEPGTYYIRCTGEAGRSGDYRVKALYEELESTEEEPNDDYKMAQLLEAGTEIRGIHTRNDEHDYYKIILEKETDIKLIVSVQDSFTTRFRFYDEDLIMLDEIYDGVAFAEEKSYSYERILPAGTYYIDMIALDVDTGGGPYELCLKDNLNASTMEMEGQESNEKKSFE